jgi:hypothetical protein
LNWFRCAYWRIEVGRVSIRYLGHQDFCQGLYSEDGELIFANGIHWMIAAGFASKPWPKDVNVTTSGWRADFHTAFPFRSWRAGYVLLGQSDWKRLAPQTPHGFSRFGFTYIWETAGRTPVWTQRGVAIPWWFLTAVFAINPTWTVIKIRRATRRGACRNCGYDLRATPARCPECGVVAAKSHGVSIHAFCRPRISRILTNRFFIRVVS